MISVKGVTIQVGSFALRKVGFEVPTGQYAVLMGKTGSGKTTLLEAICGLRPVCAGRIEMSGRDVTRLKPAERGIGYVPQDVALFSTMTVREHLAFSLIVRKWNRQAIERRVTELAELLGIRPLLGRTPHGLSGGERQRVALGRALACRPAILCLDEPLSALDDDTREETCGMLERVQEAVAVTTLHVTHRRDEARRLADQVLVVEGGEVRKLESGNR